MLLDYAGVKTPDSMQGRSFRSIMETGNEPTDWRQATYYRYWMHMRHHFNPGHFGLRTKEWKLIFYYGASDKEGRNPRTPPGWELYNVKNDPMEMKNLYNNPEYKEVVEKLKLQLSELRKEVKDSDDAYPHIKAIVEKHWDGGQQEAIEISNKGYSLPPKEDKSRKNHKKS